MQSRQLCRGLPPEWWYIGDPGNRLAIGLCRVCPALPDCLAGDPRPCAIIRAATAYDGASKAIPLCPRCGYPMGVTSRVKHTCSHCSVPKVQIPLPLPEVWRHGNLHRATNARATRRYHQRRKSTLSGEPTATPITPQQLLAATERCAATDRKVHMRQHPQSEAES